MRFNLENIVRENIKTLVPYSSARNEYKGSEEIFLDANESPYDSVLSNEKLNRYPDPLQLKVKEKIGDLKGVKPENIFLGNGSDEAIDLLIRIFCEPVVDNILICPPTYGMYEVAANINNVPAMKVPLKPDTFQLDTKTVLSSINKKTKLIFVCCPNNPTGNGVKWNDIKTILDSFNGIVVVDEAYIDFADYRSLLEELKNYPNLVILQTFSKAWGLAALRLGMAFASSNIITLMNKVKPPYNIGVITQRYILKAIENKPQVNLWIEEILSERNILQSKLEEFSFVKTVYPSQTNFFLIKVDEPTQLHSYLIEQKIVVRDRSSVILCEGCLRITIGNQQENKTLLEIFKKYENEKSIIY